MSCLSMLLSCSGMYLMCMDIGLDMLSMLVFMTGVYREGGCDYRGSNCKGSVYRGGRDLGGAGGPWQGLKWPHKKGADWLLFPLVQI